MVLGHPGWLFSVLGQLESGLGVGANNKVGIMLCHCFISGDGHLPLEVALEGSMSPI